MTANGASETRRDEMNLRMARSLVRYLRERHGVEVAERACAAAELKVDDVLHGNRWVPLEQFEALLRAGREPLRDDAEFEAAVVYRMRESYGPLFLMLIAPSLPMQTRVGAATAVFVNRIGRLRVLEASRTRARIEYRSSKHESRLMCLCRSAHLKVAGQLLDEHFSVEHERCIARGDDACTDLLRCRARAAWPIPAAGAALGIAAAAALAGIVPLAAVPWLALPVAGLAFGVAGELARVSRENAAAFEEISSHLRAMAEEATGAQRELLAFTRREGQWARLMEEQVEQRTAALQRVLDELERTGRERALDVRGFSHDLRNPLQILRLASENLAERAEHLDPESRSLFEEMQRAQNRVEALIDSLLETSSAQARSVPYAPEDVQVSELCDQALRRLKALLFDRDVAASVRASPGVPARLRLDPLLLDRVLDNLLTNAAKYTSRGSVEVEIGGTEEALRVRVTDTGPGIDEEKLRRVFRSHGGARLGPGSYGIGLAGVVRLLGAIGGRLEIDSRPGEGTTMTVDFPCRPPAVSDASDPEQLIDKVVHIRRSA